MKEIINLNNHTKIFIVVMLLFAICASYYLYKNFQNTNNELKIILVLLIFGSIFLSYYNYQENKFFDAIRNNYALSKGKINNYFVSNKVSLRGGSGANDIKYGYFINNRQFENRYAERGYVKIPDVKPNLNIEYLVIYQKDNPTNSIILLNYPLTAKNDFEKYEKIFSNGIPKDVFERN